ncbi:MAG: PPOX class F420-dependent oxidoreductase [Chloroflexota bacterium]|nr:PPOX class F420-dependent oxidoreductase [Chloroflexota bacterium]
MIEATRIQPKEIPASHRDLLEEPIVAALATTLPDGTPQVTPVWFNEEEGHILFNSARGRLKDRAIRENPYVALTIIDPENPYRYIAIRGPVVDITEEGARDHIDFLANRYLGEDEYSGPKDQVRVKYEIVPEHVATMA